MARKVKEQYHLAQLLAELQDAPNRLSDARSALNFAMDLVNAVREGNPNAKKMAEIVAESIENAQKSLGGKDLH